MKVLSHRIGEDEEDVRLLARQLRLDNAADVLEIAESVYGDPLQGLRQLLRRATARHGTDVRTTRVLADAGKEEGPVLAQHLARDHETLHLLRPLIDLRDLRVAHHPLDRILRMYP